MITHSPQETKNFAAEFLEKHLETNILALYGGLGSGKTTFVQGLAKALGVEEPVTSPTFIIMQAYPVGARRDAPVRQLIHIDLYRVSGWDDVRMLGLEEIWEDESNLVVIEWPERIEEKLPEQVQELRFEYLSEEQRILRI